MSAAADRVVTQLNARRVRENEYRARCPVHQGKSDTSLSIKDTGDKALIYCHAGCDLNTILEALGMRSAAELFRSIKTPDREAGRQARIRRGLEAWCQRRLVHVSAILRDLEQVITLLVWGLSRIESGDFPRDTETDERWWSELAWAYKTRSDLDWEFHVLNGRDPALKIELWRRCR